MNDNSNKSIRGRNAKTMLNNMLKELLKQNYIRSIDSVKEWSSANKKGYRLYAPAVITLPDGERWALYVTASYRSDRARGDRWNSFLIKHFNRAERCYLIIADPSSYDDMQLLRSAKEDFNYLKTLPNGINELDSMLSLSELRNMIEGLQKSFIAHGVRESTAGNNFEHRISDILNSKSNLDVWNSVKTAVGMEFVYFRKILDKWGCGTPLKNIETTTKISLLPSGGKPKTDVKATITYPDNHTESFTISCKRTSAKFVTVHQYKADDFIQALNVTDEKLKKHLRLFQECGSIKAMGKEAATQMEIELAPYVDRLCEWVITGEHGNYSSRDQIAQYIIVYSENQNDIQIFTSKEYIKLLKLHSHGQFGTPFSWTYASKSKGKNIQLKMKVF